MTGLKLPKQKTKPIIKRDYSAKQINTIRILQSMVGEYDILFANYNSNPTSSNRLKKNNYEVHLKSANMLSEYYIDHLADYASEEIITGKTRVRDLIRFQLEDGELITVDGLIRLPKYVSYHNNISATGNTVTIILPDWHIPNLIDILKAALINESALTISPCRNMIIVIETGNYSKDINEGLYNTVCETTMSYMLEHNLTPKDKSTTIKIVGN